MMYKMVVYNPSSGIRWCGEPTELTDSELEEVKEAIKQNIRNLTYLELGDTILPGDYIRNHCVIQFLSC